MYHCDRLLCLSRYHNCIDIYIAAGLMQKRKVGKAIDRVDALYGPHRQWAVAPQTPSSVPQSSTTNSPNRTPPLSPPPATGVQYNSSSPNGSSNAYSSNAHGSNSHQSPHQATASTSSAAAVMAAAGAWLPDSGAASRSAKSATGAFNSLMGRDRRDGSVSGQGSSSTTTTATAGSHSSNIDSSHHGSTTTTSATGGMASAMAASLSLKKFGQLPTAFSMTKKPTTTSTAAVPGSPPKGLNLP
jgi:hypothetical protein